MSLTRATTSSLMNSLFACKIANAFSTSVLDTLVKLIGSFVVTTLGPVVMILKILPTKDAKSIASADVAAGSDIS